MGVESEKGLLFDGMVLKNIGYQLKDNGIEYYHPSYRLLSDAAVAEMKANGRGLNVWTVNDEDAMRQCMKWDIRGLITNEPEKAGKLYRCFINQ